MMSLPMNIIRAIKKLTVVGSDEGVMTRKRKTKPRNFISVFMDNLLFTQTFTFETSVDEAAVIARLHESSRQRKGWRHAHPLFVLTTEDAIDHHRFDLRAKDNNQRYTIAHATGVIEATSQGGTTVSGEIRFGVVYFFLLGITVLGMFFMFQYFGFSLSTELLALVMISPLFTFGHMFWKRHYVLKDIRQAIQPRMSDRQFDKLKRSEATIESEHDYLFADDDGESVRYDGQ